VADEVYYGMVYEDDAEFTSMGQLSKEVPVICIGAISKVYCVPGWRLGWVIVYNNNGYFEKVIDRLHKHTMIQLHPTSLVQAALPSILNNVADEDLAVMRMKL
jgi:tyrosine aminotransferase